MVIRICSAAAALLVALGVATPRGAAQLSATETVLRVTADMPAEDRCFGYSVAADGDRLVVGAYRFDVGRTDTGAAFVFARAGDGTWSLEGELTTPALLPRGSLFGATVAIDTDTDTVVVGAPEVDLGPDRFGSAYVFARVAGTWSHQATLVSAPRQVNSRFGRAVAVGGDQIIVGAWNEAGAGAAYVFTRTGTVWDGGTRLELAGSPAGARFGFDLSVREGRLAVAAPGYDDGADGTREGAVALFEDRGAAGWVFDELILPRAPVEAGLFGDALALGDDLLVVRQRGADEESGYSDVLRRVGGAWIVDGTLPGGEGTAVGDDRVAVASQVSSAGTLRVFRPEMAGGWAEIAALAAGEATVRGLGYGSLALVGDLVVAGACNAPNGSDQDLGSVHVFELPLGINGAPCAVNPECASGYCIDGVCCNTACGGGSESDCQACSVAAGADVDGVCGALAASVVCRESVDVCDVQERCDGVVVECPADAVPTPGCCAMDRDCDDDDACTFDTCPMGLCAHAALAGCDMGDAGVAVDAGRSISDAGPPSFDAGADAGAERVPRIPTSCWYCGVARGGSGRAWIGSALACLGLGLLRLRRRRARRPSARPSR